MIPVAVTDGLSAFQVAIEAARPISQAPALQTVALLRQGNALIATIDDAIAASGQSLDGADMSGYAPQVVDKFLAVVQSGSDHGTLHDLRGFVGRAVFNLAQGYA